jgi:hypothetical protein
MALDGGSIFFEVVSPSDQPFTLYLEWSVDAQATGKTQFSVDRKPIPKGSSEEAAWLTLLRNAAVPPKSSLLKPASQTSARILLVPQGDAAYFEAMDRSPSEALRVLIGLFIDRVTSHDYQDWTPPLQPPSTDEVVRALLAEGRRIDAMRAYRHAHPNLSPTEAKLAVEWIAGQANSA